MLGERYAELFPRQVRRMALDGALVHSLPAETLFKNEAAAYETALRHFSSWCAQTIDDVVAAADRHPIPAPGCAGHCRPFVTGEGIRLNSRLLLFKRPIPTFAPGGWNDFAEALAQAAAGDATALASGLAGSPDDDTISGSGIAIECLLTG